MRAFINLILDPELKEDEKIKENKRKKVYEVATYRR